MTDLLTIHVPGEIRGKGHGSPKKATNEQIVAAYVETGNVWKAAERLGMCGQSVHERLVKLGEIRPMNVFTDVERAILTEQYNTAADAGQLDALAKTMGRTKPFIARQARALGLTNPARKRRYLVGVAGEALRAWFRINEHPRGMLGKKHAAAACEAMSKTRREKWEAMTDEQRAALTLKQLRAKAKKNGGNLPIAERPDSSWKAGWREIGGQRVYFRSRWEANYARYLQSLVEAGEVLSWEHEPKTFWFEGVRRGSVSYLPDFRVVDAHGNVTFHEVKGWMDERSVTKLARMAKYFPEVAMVVIDKDAYRKLKTLLAYTLDGWEA